MYKGWKKILLILGIIAGLIIQPAVLMTAFSSAVTHQVHEALSLAQTPDKVEEDLQRILPNVSDEEDENDSFERGILTETTYESEWAGLRFTCPSGLYLESREELDIGMTDENGELLDNTGIINELGVYNADNSFYLALSVENIFYEGMTVDEYLQFIVSTYSSETFNYQYSDSYDTVQIGSLTYAKLSISSTDEGGIPFHEDFYVTLKDNRFIVISSYYSDDTAGLNEQAMGAFTAY